MILRGGGRGEGEGEEGGRAHISFSEPHKGVTFSSPDSQRHAISVLRGLTMVLVLDRSCSKVLLLE